MATTLAMPQNFEQDVAAMMPDLLWNKNKKSKSTLARALPYSYTDASMVQWNQYNNPYGLIPLRGVGAAPDAVRMPGLKKYQAAPGFYGLVTLLDENEILFGRQPNTVADPLEIDDRLGVLAMNGAEMVYNRVRKTSADLLVSGEFSNLNTSGEIVHAYKVDDYQTFSPANDGDTGPGWAADPANADPIGDLIYWQIVKLNKGTSASFGADSELICNPTVLNDMWKCTSVRERFKSRFGASVLRGDGTGPLEGDQSLNSLLTGMGLPKLTIDNEGYYPTIDEAKGQDPDDFDYFVPAKSLIWIGVRPEGQPIGSFKLTRHAGLVTPSIDFDKVDVANLETAELAKGIYVNAHYRNKMPHGYELEMGFNAAPILYYRRATAGITYT